MPSDIVLAHILNVNSTFAASAQFLISLEFMRRLSITRKIGYSIFLINAQLLILYISQFNPDILQLTHVVNCIIITCFIYTQQKNLLKSINLTLSIFLAFTALMYAFEIGTFVFLHGFILTSNIFMLMNVIYCTILLSAKKDYFFGHKINDVNLLQFYCAFKVLLFILFDFGTPKIYGLANPITLSRLIALFAVVIGFYYTKYISERIMELERENKTASNLQIKSEIVDKAYTEVIVFKHNYRGLVRSLAGYISENDMEGLRSYYTKHIAPISEELNTKTGDYEQQLSLIEIELIKARIIELINTLSQFPNIKFYLVIDSKIDNIAMDEIDFFKILNIYIDNAVEETQTQKEGRIIISFLQEYDKFSFMIENSIKNFKSTPKPDNTHMGLKIVDEIISRYPKANKQTIVQFNSYIQYIEIGNEYFE